MGCFPGRLMSAASDQKLFCKLCSPFNCSFDEFVGEKVVSPSYSSAILTPSPRDLILNVNSPLLSSFWAFSFALGHGVSPHSHSSAYHLSGLSLTYMRSPWLIYYSLKLYTFEYHQSYTSVPFPHNHQFSLCFCKFSFLDSSCEIIQYLSFSSDISLSKMWSSSIHVVANVRTSTCLVSEPHWSCYFLQFSQGSSRVFSLRVSKTFATYWWLGLESLQSLSHLHV